jgi:hypothetical protein
MDMSKDFMKDAFTNIAVGGLYRFIISSDDHIIDVVVFTSNDDFLSLIDRINTNFYKTGFSDEQACYLISINLYINNNFSSIGWKKTNG